MDLQQTCSLSPLLTNIVHAYFLNIYSILVVYDVDFESNIDIFPKYECAIQDSIIARNNNHSVEPVMLHFVRFSLKNVGQMERNKLMDNIELGLQGYIIVSSDIERFLNIKYELQQTSDQRIRDLIFLFLADFNTQPDELFQHNAFNFYPHHLVVLPTDKTYTTFELWTQQFVGFPDESSNAILLDVYLSNGTFQSGAQLYWDKTLDLMGRPMSVATVSYLPYSLTEFVDEGTGNVNDINSTLEKTIFYDGTEGRTVLEFCRIRNCTLEILAFPGDYWGGIYNGTGEGQIGAVYDRQVEFAIGCIYKWYSDIFDMTQSVAKSAVTLLVPAALPLSYALTPILPFAPSTWLFLFVTMNISVVLYFVIKWFSELLSFKETVVRLADVDRSKFRTSFQTTYLEMIAVLLQQSFDQGTSRVAVRTVYCVLLISGITLENAYSGGLKALLTIPRYHDKIQTVHEFVLTGYHWGAPQPAWAYSIVHAQVPDDLAMYQRFESHDNERLHNLSFTRNYGIGIERLHAGSFSFYDYVQMDSLVKQDMLREDVYYDYSNGYAVRGWPLMPHFDEIAMQVTQHGLLNIWETQIVNHYLNFTIGTYLRQLSTGYTETAPPEVLRVGHIFGPLVMLLVGVTIASCLFAAEHAVHRMQKRKLLRELEEKQQQQEQQQQQELD